MPDRPLDQAIAPKTDANPDAHDAPGGEKHFPIVALGASAGGLNACCKLLDVLPAASGMAFILIQHLDPNHESLLVDLLAEHTKMAVRQAADGMLIEPDHLYVIAPGTYLSIGNGALHVAEPQARHGARMPFDYLLHSLATDRGRWAICVVLSGTGADGGLGLRTIKDNHGLVIAQEPEEADYNGMPRTAIMTGAVDLVLPIARIPAALHDYQLRLGQSDSGSAALPGDDKALDSLPALIELMRTKTNHDFRLYKPGTLLRRIERRMGMTPGQPNSMTRYEEILRTDEDELNLLVKDLLINVTGFFRDAQVFDVLAHTIIPAIVGDQAPDQPIRIWTAGCSTGEETYSLAMLFLEEIAATNPKLRLQVFASDVDPDAIAIAREGLYPATIANDVSPDRLSRFFSSEDHRYRVSSDLRASVIFTVQDVLADPPFSRLNMVSCRNLLIYLQPEAQAKIIALFHFALRAGGILLLGKSETIGNADDRFEGILKAERLYRHIGRSRPGQFGFLKDMVGAVSSAASPDRAGQPALRQIALADLCRRLVMETYAPAAVMINRRHECLYSLGPTDRYLRVAPGPATLDLLSMARQSMRSKLRSAIQQAIQRNARVVIAGGRMAPDSPDLFSIAVQPVRSDGEDLLLICFVDEPNIEPKAAQPSKPGDAPKISELERELAATRTELQGAIHNLEVWNEEQRAVNEEALSIQEEYQSTNEELLTSKEELQSLNEELTALNSQLQETLERQRITANDLKNVLYSTDVATLFLDPNLNIRFFTPTSRALFNIIPSDIGRPLSDLNFLAVDGELLTDARTVLRTGEPLAREIEAGSGAWYHRRVLPYRAQDDGVEGVVITFADITERRHAAEALEAARHQAEQANAAKSRFLAAASHDLRQPLQTLALVQGILAKTVQGENAQRLLVRLDDTLGAMAGMLNTLLDINQIDAGTVKVEQSDFPINDLLVRLRDEFTYHAQAKGISLRVVACSVRLRSDPRLLEQMLRNLLNNALKYTRQGKVLLGCRRQGDRLSLQVWDTGVGIQEEDTQLIFDEYHQLDNPAREHSRGLGLGLSIVRRLGELLDHQINVRSCVGKGSVFSVRAAIAARGPGSPGDVDGRRGKADPRQHPRSQDDAGTQVRHTGTILVVEDDPDIRDLLAAFLNNEGHRAITAADGVVALDMVVQGKVKPDLILADYNLPNGLDGVQAAVKVRAAVNRQIPVIMLTGDISTTTLRDVAVQDCIPLNKPVNLKELTRAINRLLREPRAASNGRTTRAAPAADLTAPPVIFVVDDDAAIRLSIRDVLEQQGRAVEDYASCELFLEAYRPGRRTACLVVDAYLPGMSGIDLLKHLHDAGHRLPAIVITGSSDVPIAVQAMKAGAVNFIEKPIGPNELVESVNSAIEQSLDSSKLSAWRASAAAHVAALTARQRQIMTLVLAGLPSKNIAAELGISQRTVENHRASIMKRTGTKSLPELARLALAAAQNDADDPEV